MITKILIEDLYHDFNTGNIPAVLELIDDKVEWLVHGSPEIPVSGHFFNKDEVLGFFGVIGGAMDIHTNDFTKCIIHNDTAITIGETSATVKSTGKTYTTIFIDIFRMKDAKVIKYERLMNTFELYKAFLR